MTDSYIDTSTGKFYYQTVPLTQGTGKIDKEIALENLLIAKEIFEAAGINFGLMFGTLLGAVRGSDFIDWDEDVDLYVLDEQRQLIHDALPTLRARGLELIRVHPELYSIMRKQQYIDLYFFRNFGKTRKCLFYEFHSDHLASKDTIKLRGFEFRTPCRREELLESFYGKDWRVPQKNKGARGNTTYHKLMRILTKYFPAALRIARSVKGRIFKRP